MFAAEHGSAAARQALEGPECPESLLYLMEWVHDLHARSGVGMNGYAPISWGTLGEWSRFTGIVPNAEEIGALFTLDAVLLNPGDGKTAE